MQEKETKEMDRLSFEGFCTCVRIDIGHRIGDAEVAVTEIMKPNDIRQTGLVIMEKDRGNVFPAVYLEEFYREYLHGRSIGQIEEKILSIHRMNCFHAQLDMSLFMDWGWVKERVVYRLVSRDLNREYLKDKAYIAFLDLAVVFCCHLDTEELGESSITISTSHLEMWGVTVEELYSAAKRNTPRLLPPEISGMGELVRELADVRVAGAEADAPPHILSNRGRCFGSACILYPDVLKGFADRVGTDLYILPSSVHEVLLLPAEKWIRVRELDAMVCTVNMTQLDPMEVLSDHAYRFVRETGKIITMQEEKG